MSAPAASVALILALKAFYRVNVVVTCDGYYNGTSDGTSDYDLDHLHIFAVGTSASPSFTAFSPHTSNSEEERVIVVPRNIQCLTQALDNFGLRRNIVYLVGSDFEAPKDLRLDSNWVLLEEEKDGKIFLRENYRVNKGALMTTMLGTWIEPSRSLDVPIPSKWLRRSDLGGSTLTTTMLPWPFLGILSDDGLSASGFIPDAFKDVERALNLSKSVLLPPEDGQWGVRKCQDDVCIWTGMVGQLERGEADVCTAGLSMTPERRVFRLNVSLPHLTQKKP